MGVEELRDRPPTPDKASVGKYKIAESKSKSSSLSSPTQSPAGDQLGPISVSNTHYLLELDFRKTYSCLCTTLENVMLKLGKL